MFEWYFNNYFIENNEIFIIGMSIIILIIIITAYLICKEVKNAHK